VSTAAFAIARPHAIDSSNVQYLLKPLSLAHLAVSSSNGAYLHPGIPLVLEANNPNRSTELPIQLTYSSSMYSFESLKFGMRFAV
jgi:hypothetical protein